MFRILLLALCTFFSFTAIGSTANTDINLRNGTSVATQANEPTLLAQFRSSDIGTFFFSPTLGGESVQNTFVTIAGSIKNFFITIAVIFLIIGVLKLLFSGGDEESAKKWRKNIIWVSVGIFVMQIAYSIWVTLYFNLQGAGLGPVINGSLGYTFWKNIFEPIVNILLMLASLGFLIMAVYAFYIIVTGGGDEEKLKKGKNIIIYALIGFLLVRLPKPLILAIYGKPSPGCGGNTFNPGICEIEEKNIGGAVEIFGKLIVYLNGFLMLLAVILVIYAGYLVLISGGEEEKLKKAKSMILYVFLGLLLIVASHALFRFFILG